MHDQYRKLSNSRAFVRPRISLIFEFLRDKRKGSFLMKTSTETTAPSYSKFAQQELPAWRPMITPVKAMIWLFIIGAFSFICGPIFYVSANNTIKVETRYDDKCELDKECDLQIEIPEEMKGKIYMKYKLTNYYQNHRRFMESRSRDQLAGEYVDYSGMSSCDPVRSVNDSSSEDNWILPCGLSATTVFNDTFEVPFEGFSESGIAWASDKEYMYKNLSSKYTKGNKWLDALTDIFPGGSVDEHFIVWMRVSALSTVVKKYAICDDCTIEKGSFTVKIQNNYPTTGFKGNKYFILETDSAVESNNRFLGIIYFIIGSICFAIIIALLIMSVFFPRKLGDQSLIQHLIDQKEKELSLN